MAPPKLYKDTNLHIVFGITLMAVLGVSSITPAFPSIVKALQVSSQSIGLLITVFTLPGVFLTPFFGILADRTGRKKILIPALLLFAVAGSSCAFTRTFSTLLLLRFFQGVGAASLGSLNVTLIGDLYTGKERTTAMGYNASVLSVGTASYPAVGGFLAMFGWFYPFLLPLAAVPVGVAVLFLNNPESTKKHTLKEYLGKTWDSIKKSTVLALFLAAVITFIMLYGSLLTYLPFLTDQSFGASPFTVGLLLAAMSASTAVTSSLLGRIAQILPEKTLIKISFVLYPVALVMIPVIPVIYLLAVPITLFGIAHGLNIPSIQTVLAGYAPLEQRAAFMSFYGMVLRLGQTLGPVIMGVVFAAGGITTVFYVGACFSVGMALIAVVCIT
ncbi:MAG: MFS transporter [Candidatus Methanofastidiosia archaeon]|jgi:MFS family permease